MFEKDNSSEIETLLIPALEMREAAGRLKKILGINAELNFDPRTGQKLGNAWEQLEAINWFARGCHEPMTRDW